jgi:hypothetical protein
MTDDERDVYRNTAERMMMRRLVVSFGHLKVNPDKRKGPKRLNSRNIKFVGMRFYGDHIFSPDDKIRLETDDPFFRPNYVKVMLRKSKKWKHVAYLQTW